MLTYLSGLIMIDDYKSIALPIEL